MSSAMKVYIVFALVAVLVGILSAFGANPFKRTMPRPGYIMCNGNGSCWGPDGGGPPW